MTENTKNVRKFARAITHMASYLESNGIEIKNYNLSNLTEAIILVGYDDVLYGDWKDYKDHTKEQIVKSYTTFERMVYSTFVKLNFRNNPKELKFHLERATHQLEMLVKKPFDSTESDEHLNQLFKNKKS